MEKREIHQVINIDDLSEVIRERLRKAYDVSPQQCTLILIAGDEKRTIIGKNARPDLKPKYGIDEE